MPWRRIAKCEKLNACTMAVICLPLRANIFTSLFFHSSKHVIELWNDMKWRRDCQKTNTIFISNVFGDIDAEFWQKVTQWKLNDITAFIRFGFHHYQISKCYVMNVYWTFCAIERWSRIWIFVRWMWCVVGDLLFHLFLLFLVRFIFPHVSSSAWFFFLFGSFSSIFFLYAHHRHRQQNSITTASTYTIRHVGWYCTKEIEEGLIKFDAIQWRNSIGQNKFRYDCHWISFDICSIRMVSCLFHCPFENTFL